MNKPAEYLEELHNLPVYYIENIFDTNIKILCIYITDILSLLYNNLPAEQAVTFSFNLGMFLELYGYNISHNCKAPKFCGKFTIINALNNLYDNGISYYEIIKSTKSKANGYIIKKFIEENKELGGDNYDD